MRQFKLTFVFILLVVISVAQPTHWRGPKGDGKFTDAGLLKKWPDGGPQLVLKVEGIGKGYSSVIATDKYMLSPE